MSNLLEKASILTTPTAYDDGKILSVKPSIVLGAELVTNGDFSDGTNGWGASGEATISVVNGELEVNVTGGGGGFVRTSNIPCIDGRTYIVSIDYRTGTYVGDVLPIIDNNSLGLITPTSETQTKTWKVVAIGSSFQLAFVRSAAYTGTIYYDNVSVKEAIDGDFDFTRNSSATRLNEQGFVEDVQILSSNLVQNGDFSQEGSEQITNGGFDTDLSGWTYSSGVTWNNGKAEVDALDGSFKYIEQIITSSGTKTYKISFEISNIQGSVQLTEGTSLVTEKSTNGTFEVYYETTTTNPAIQFKRKFGTNTFFELDNVSVKEVGQDWTLGTGWSIGDGKAIHTGDSGYIQQNNLGASGVNAIYKVKWTQNITAGTRLRFFARNYNDSGNETILSGSTTGEGSFGLNGNCVGSGTFTAFVSSTNGYSFKMLGETGVNADITNVSVIEITDDTNLPRIDYTDGVGSWLFEPQSTNLMPNANQYSGNTVYYTVTPNQSSPDGENNATLFVEKTSTSNYNVSSINASIIGGQTYAYSFFVKYAGKQNIPVNATDGISGYIANIDILNGTVNSGNAEIKDFGDGWYRVSMTRTVNASASSAKILFQFGNQTGDGTSGFYLFGFQIEQSSFATSYIPTNGSTVTRLQDAAFGAGSSDLINSTEGVLYFEAKTLVNGETNSNIILSDGTNNNLIMLRFGITANRVTAFARGSGGSYSTLTINGVTQTDDNKFALVWDSSNFRVWINGTERSTTTINSIPSGMNSLNFTSSSGIENFFGKTKCLAVFKEALTDEELTCLTTI